MSNSTEKKTRLSEFKDSLMEAIKKSGLTFETISRPLYLITCEKFNIKGWLKDEIKAYGKSWAMLKKDAIRCQFAEDPRVIKSNNNAVIRGEGELSETELMKLSEDMPEEKMEILAEYAQFIKEFHYVPTTATYRKWSRNGLNRTFYRSTQELDMDYRRYFPKESEAYLFDKESWNTAYKEEFQKELERHTKFIFTSIGSFCDVDMNFVESLYSYAVENNAMLIGLPLFKRYSKGVSDFCIPAELNRKMWVAFSDITLNANLMVQVIKANCTTKSTLTGLNQLVAKYGTSIIVAGINQQLRYIPVLKDKTPNMIASTGCCTNYEPVSRELTYIPTKAEKLAQERLSIKGALIVEIGPEDSFTVRNIEADNNGEIIDCGRLYSHKRPSLDVFGSTFVIGDLHAPQHNEVLLDANIKAIEQFGCNQVVLHDSVNMTYVSHHNANQAITRAQLVENGKADILVEIRAFADILKRLAAIPTVEKIIVPYSNHPSHLEKCIQDIGRATADDINLRTLLKSALAMLDNLNVLQYLVEEIVGVKIPKVEWLNEDEGKEVYGVQIGLHGCEKVNGGRMTSTTTNNAFPKTVLAHKHSASIDGDTITVGIVCEKDQGYNHGLSSWTESSAIVYPNGKVQLLTFVNVKGDYKLWL